MCDGYKAGAIVALMYRFDESNIWGLLVTLSQRERIGPIAFDSAKLSAAMYEIDISW
jgi:hypothetical protein